MRAFTWIAEQRIKEAIESGELDNLPGMGKPLQLDDDFAIHSENRLAYTILKNAGFLPFPLLLRKEIENKFAELERTLENCRLRSNYILDQILKAWQDISHYFPNRRSLMHYLNLTHLPHHPKLDNVSYGRWSWRSKKKKLHLWKRNILKLIKSYNNCIQIYRKHYINLLSEINEKICELRFECLKEEIRKGGVFAGFLEMNCIHIPKKMEKFDSEFPRFLFKEGDA